MNTLIVVILYLIVKLALEKDFQPVIIFLPYIVS